MQTGCRACGKAVDLFPSYVIVRNAYPERKPEIQVVCPQCGDVFQGLHGEESISCPSCKHQFNPEKGPAKGIKATCPHCSNTFTILDAVGRKRPPFRLYAKLVLTANGRKEYLAVSEDDQRAYADCSKRLEKEVGRKNIILPSLNLENGHNTRQAMSYGFLGWRDFFNDRQLFALSLLQSAILRLSDEAARNALLMLFSGVLEFNNLFASYKGEGTGAVRHMFSHHILKPERTPIEANVWGTPKSSGSFSNLFRSRLLRAVEYHGAPTEVNGTGYNKSLVCSSPFTGELQQWGHELPARGIALSCGDSSVTGLPDRSIDLIVTDPPFFDNVHYSELADFFYAWQQIGNRQAVESTRNESEVQDTNPWSFGRKLKRVFSECHRVLKDDGLLVFTYHHSRDEGWQSVADAVLGAKFIVVNSHPVKSEMSVATPKSQAKEPIQFDIILVCRKATKGHDSIDISHALESARAKLQRLESSGFELSRNDYMILFYGQMLTTLEYSENSKDLSSHVEAELKRFDPSRIGSKGRAVNKEEPPAKTIQLTLGLIHPLKR
jgi:putative DNA methylase